MNKLQLSIFSCLVLLVFSCKEPAQKKTGQLLETKDYNFLVLNEGNYGWGNAEISVVYSSGEVIHDAFKSKNGMILGDVAQSITANNGLLYTVVNNSGKIEVMDLNTLKSIKTIKGLNSPRYTTFANGKMFVSELYSDSISVFDVNSHLLLKKVFIKGWTEKMFADDCFVYIQNVSSKRIYVLDHQKLNLVDSINIDNKVIDLVGVNSGVCFLTKGILPNMLQIGLISSCSKTIDKNIVIGDASEDANIAVIEHTDASFDLFIRYGDNLIGYKLDANWNTIGDKMVYALPINGNYYGMEINKKTKELYVLDARDYVSRGKVIVFDINSKAVKATIETGVIPTGIYCKP